MRFFGSPVESSPATVESNPVVEMFSRKVEKRIALPPSRNLTPSDPDTLETSQQLLSEGMVDIHLPKDESRHYCIHNQDGTVTWAEAVNINGVQWYVDVGVKTKVPLSIYKILTESPHYRDLFYCPEPGRPLNASPGQVFKRGA